MEIDDLNPGRMKRIVITGAESTGKTTLARSLAAHFKAPLSAEFVRSYVDNIKRPLAVSDLEHLARGQLALENASLEDANNGLVFHDTNLLSTQIYGGHYFGADPDWLVEALTADSYQHYLLCMPDFPWVPDPGQRESPAARDCLHAKFLMRLEELDLPYSTIQGKPEERLRSALESLASLEV
jgi:NadR type nicotinamide-nucleotide adenylyltransferase